MANKIRTLEEYEKSAELRQYFEDNSLNRTFEIYGKSNFGLFSRTLREEDKSELRRENTPPPTPSNSPNNS